MIDLNNLKKNIVFKLFDASILPVVSYACQEWLPHKNFMKDFAKNSEVLTKKNCSGSH
jgi:hypothetical protein